MRPVLGLLGVGWIGRARMRSIAASGLADIVAVADADPTASAEAAEEVGATSVDPAVLLAGDLDLDGLVIATPSALHAEQAVTALADGVAVFCQKPLGRTAGECAAVVDAARHADRLLGVDLSYRFLHAVSCLHEVVGRGGIGRPYAADLVFHNAYGPDKGWFLDPALAGGGCVIDLGTHLVDLGLGLLGRPPVEHVASRLYRRGHLFGAGAGGVEDHGMARIDLAGGVTMQLACSWFLPAGQDAVIGATVYGDEGAVVLANVGGSFYDFTAERRHATNRQVLASPPDDWGGRAAVDWVQRLGAGARFDEQVTDVVGVAEVIDRVYGR